MFYNSGAGSVQLDRLTETITEYYSDPKNQVLGASEVSANLYCNSRTSVLGRLRDYLRLLMKRSVIN